MKTENTSQLLLLRIYLLRMIHLNILKIKKIEKIIIKMKCKHR